MHTATADNDGGVRELAQRVKQAMMNLQYVFFFSFCFLSFLILYFRYYDTHTVTAGDDRGTRELAITVKLVRLYILFAVSISKLNPFSGN